MELIFFSGLESFDGNWKFCATTFYPKLYFKGDKMLYNKASYTEPHPGQLQAYSVHAKQERGRVKCASLLLKAADWRAG